MIGLMGGCYARSKEFAQLLDTQLCVGKDAAQGSLRDVAAPMNRHRRAAAIWVAHDVVAASDPSSGETCFFECLHDPLAGHRWQLRH